MWSEKLETGKVKFIERYKNPLTGRYGRVSVIMEKDTASTRKAALVALTGKIEKKIAELGEAPAPDALTLKALLDLYIDSQKSTCKESTWTRNRFSLSATCRNLGEDTLVSSLSAGYIRGKLSALNIENGKYNEYMVRFKAMLRWAYENDYISDIRFLDKIKRLPDEEKKKKLSQKYLERDELATLLEAMQEERWKLLTEFLVLSGLRFGEAAALLRSDIDLKNDVIHVTKTYDQNNDRITSTKTFTSTRDVFVQQELKKVSTSMLNIGALFSPEIFYPDYDGYYLHYFDFNKYLKETSEKAIGRRLTTHALRHTHVSLMAEAGVPLEVISRRLGHADSSVTRDIYCHVTKRQEEKDRAAISCVSLMN